MEESSGEAAMVRSYLEVARRSWEDEDFKRRLAESPREALVESGWEIPEGTEVEVTIAKQPSQGEAPATEEIVAAWERGIEARRLRVFVPDSPPPGLETVELSDEQLQQASAGGCKCDDPDLCGLTWR